MLNRKRSFTHSNWRSLLSNGSKNCGPPTSEGRPPLVGVLKTSCYPLPAAAVCYLLF